MSNNHARGVDREIPGNVGKPADVYVSQPGGGDRQTTFMRRLPAIVSRASTFARPVERQQHREIEAVCQRNRLGAAVRAARQELQRPLFVG
jgi:hypothetical protein